jgi:thiosulfate/3-mercaptopyruvate sulfurtransferase
MNTSFTKLIIEADELSSKLNSAVILDCRFSLTDASAGRADYQRGHIPGAHHCDLDRHLSSHKSEQGGRHPLPAESDFFDQLTRWGINTQTEVVVYDDQKFAFASRAWWLLSIAGISNVRILNGGYRAWQNAGYNQDRRTAPEKNLSVSTGPEKQSFDTSGIKGFNEIQTSLASKELTLIDSREAIRYRGESEPIDPIAGHIPGALNFPWAEVSDDQGYILPFQFHNQRWQDIQQADKKTVIYCGSGVTACVNLLSATLANRAFTIYAGSWSDWISHRHAPIAVSPPSMTN